MLILISALIVAGAVLYGATLIAGAVQTSRAARDRVGAREMLAAFAPAVAAAEHDVRLLLAWDSLARTARRLLPEEFALLDSAAGKTFPFDKDRIQAAHARWTSDWLSWEQAHDLEFKIKAEAAEHELAAGDDALGRARLERVEREKLDAYQRRYEEYVRVAKALQALAESTPPKAG